MDSNHLRIIEIKKELTEWFPFCKFSVHRGRNNSSNFDVILDVGPIQYSDFVHIKPFTSNFLAGEHSHLTYSDDSKILFKSFSTFIRCFNDQCEFYRVTSFGYTKHYTQEDVSDWKSQLARTLLVNV